MTRIQPTSGLARVAALLLALHTSAALGQVPAAIPYQGFLTDPAGAPLDATSDVVVRLWEDPSSQDQGAFLYEERHADVDIVKGLFTLTIGTGTVEQGSPSFSEELFEDGFVWLELEISGETLAPRAQINSVAYALRAQTVEALAAGSVNSAAVQDGSLSAIDLADEAGASFVDGAAGIRVPESPETVVAQTLTINAPRDGVAIVTASGTFSTPRAKRVRCSLSDAQILDSDVSFSFTTAQDRGGTVPFSSTLGFQVSAGSATFFLVCSRDSLGTNPQDIPLVVNPSMTVIYVPSDYS
ncbi:MAG: hypothetical protein QNK05_03850 [Myxococcota bacterium]|nr:hypothetical protein [Myxococcota bacterium]